MEENNQTPEQPINEVVEEITATTVEEPVTPEPAKADVAFTNKAQSKGKGMAIGMICLAILAIAGIAFGVWAMMDKDNTVKDLNSQITTLKSQNSDLSDQVENLENQLLEATTEIVDCEVTPEAEECLDVDYAPITDNEDETTDTNLNVTVTE